MLVPTESLVEKAVPSNTTVNDKAVKIFLFIARDISNLKNYELELNRKNEALQRINEYLDNFVHAAAHHWLTRFLGDPAQRAYLDTYLKKQQGEINRLERTLNDWLNWCDSKVL